MKLFSQTVQDQITAGHPQAERLKKLLAEYLVVPDPYTRTSLKNRQRLRDKMRRLLEEPSPEKSR